MTLCVKLKLAEDIKLLRYHFYLKVITYKADIYLQLNFAKVTMIT